MRILRLIFVLGLVIDMFGFSFMDINAVKHQIKHDRMFLSDYYVYFYHVGSDLIFRFDASDIYKMTIMTFCSECVLLGYSRMFMRNRFDLDSRDISDDFMDSVRMLDL